MENKNNNTNFLANIFYFLHEVVVAADKPISMLVGVLLPFIAPLLPALITARSLKDFMKFDDAWTWIAVISFELVGYLGMIAAVGAAMRLSKNSDKEKIESLTWNRNFYLTAYVIYLITLIVANTILEIVNNVSLAHVAVIFCLTVGLSISAGILNASRIYERDEKDEQDIRRREKTDFKLKTKALEHGINVFSLNSNYPSSSVNPSVVSSPKNGDWRNLSDKEKREVINVLTIDEIMKKYSVGRSTAFGWKNKTI